jgi:DNA-binding NarL/FixJ family response regulator
MANSIADKSSDRHAHLIAAFAHDLRPPLAGSAQLIELFLVKQQGIPTKVLMLTSHGDDNNLFSAFAAGADGYVLKDSGIQTLDLSIGTVIGGAVWLDSRIAKRVLQYAIVSAALTPAPRTPAEPLIKLTERETEVLRFLCDGLTNVEIAEKSSLTTETVKTHVSKIMHKLAVHDRTEAAVKAVRSHLI